MIQCDLTTPHTIGFYSLHPEARLPEKKTEGAACFDLHACVDNPLTLKPGERMMIPTGLVFDIPSGYSVRVHGRSGLGVKHGITLVLTEGVIDSDYTDEVFVPLINHGDKNFTIYTGDRIAQIELVKNIKTDVHWVEERPMPRGGRDGGFGSTGVK